MLDTWKYTTVQATVESSCFTKYMYMVISTYTVAFNVQILVYA